MHHFNLMHYRNYAMHLTHISFSFIQKEWTYQSLLFYICLVLLRTGSAYLFFPTKLYRTHIHISTSKNTGPDIKKKHHTQNFSWSIFMDKYRLLMDFAPRSDQTVIIRAYLKRIFFFKVGYFMLNKNGKL